VTVLLYDNPVSGNCYKVRLILNLLGIEFERRELSVVDRSAQVLQWMFFEQYKHEPAIADIALYAYTHVAPEAGFDLGRYTAVGRWLKRVASQPGIVPITA
jgi:glutathione S-transferase